jgi:tripartite-type tricarboxylate transporter receptor subunit TctC
MPEIPTTAEAGFPQLVAENSYALFAPARTPAQIVARLHDAVVAALALSDVRDRLREAGADVVGSSSAELAACGSRDPEMDRAGASSRREGRMTGGEMSDAIIRDKAEYHARTTEQMERH